jgi:hypothetical protein
MEEPWFEFEVVQNGTVVASAGSADEDAARREAMHYAMMYAQDGPCVVRPLPAPPTAE